MLKALMKRIIKRGSAAFAAFFKKAARQFLFLLCGAGLLAYPGSYASAYGGGQGGEQAQEAYPSDPASFFLNQQERIFKLHQMDLTKEEQRRHIGVILEESFAAPQIERHVLGRHGRRLAEEQKRRFSCLFKQAMIQQIQAYGEIIGDKLLETQIKIKGHREKKSGLSALYTEVIPPGGQPIEVIWKLRRTAEGRYQVLDISIEGISIVLTLRNTYSSLIQKSGGFEPFLDLLREKTSPPASEADCF